jgi:hypothetical protein
MHTFTRAASLAAMCHFVFACSEGASTSTTGAGGFTGSTGSTGSGGADSDAARAILDTFCNAVAAPFCEAVFACCASPGIFLKAGPDADVATNIKYCEQVVPEGRELPLCESGRRDDIAAHLRDGFIVFDQAQFDTCLDLLKSMTAGGAACVEPPKHVLLSTCTSAFRGQIALGDACPYPEELFRGRAFEAGAVCKDGRCEHGKCVPFLKPGDACDLSIDQQLLYSNPAPIICNFVNKEVCWGDPGAGGAGGGGDAGGAAPMGTCRPQGELGDACNPGNVHECKSFHCDATGKCVLRDPATSACQDL